MPLFIKKSYTSWASSRKVMFWFGLSIGMLATLQQLLIEKHRNFLIFRHGTLDTWIHINPYLNWEHPLDKYVYGPLFSVFFLPFAVLPDWMGTFVWNACSYSIFFISIFSLPTAVVSSKNKTFIYWFLLPILLTSIHSFQYNVIIAAIFLIAFTLLEQKKYLLAISIILFSAFTKIYGIIQLGTIIFYDKIVRNIIIIILVSLVFWSASVINVHYEEIGHYYTSWFWALQQRHNPAEFYTIFRLLAFVGIDTTRSSHLIQIVFALILGISTLMCYKKFKHLPFRVKALGVFMAWVILFGTASECHTYLIALLGYLLWYFQGTRTIWDRILLWVNFAILIISPIDVFCPTFIHEYIFRTLHINEILFTITWAVMYYDTFWMPSNQVFTSTSPEND